MPETRAPSLAATIQAAVAAGLVDCHTAIPARVVKYDASKQQADCKPLVKRAYRDEEGARQVASIPVVCGVPVMFPGAGGYRVTFPVQAGDTDGDTCLLVFSEASLDRWLSGSGQEVDPAIDVSHALTDAVCILGLRPFGNALGNVPTSGCTIGIDSGTFVPVGLGDAIKQQFDDLKTFLDGLTLTGSITGTANLTSGAVTGTATVGPPSSQSPTVPDVESDTVKVSR